MASVEKAASISLGVLAFSVAKRSPRVRAAVSASLFETPTAGLVGLTRKRLQVGFYEIVCSIFDKYSYLNE